MRLEKNESLLIVLAILYIVIITITETLINDVLITNILAFLLISLSIGIALIKINKILNN